MKRKKYHLNFSKDSKFPSDKHSYKRLNRDLFIISTNLNRYIFESIFNQLAVNRYIPSFKHCGLKTSDFKLLKRNQQQKRTNFAIYARCLRDCF